MKEQLHLESYFSVAVRKDAQDDAYARKQPCNALLYARGGECEMGNEIYHYYCVRDYDFLNIEDFSTSENMIWTIVDNHTSKYIIIICLTIGRVMCTSCQLARPST